MTHPSDGDQFASPHPEQNSSADQPWAASEQPQSPHGDAQVPGADQSSTPYEQGSPAYGQGSPTSGPQIPQETSWAPAPTAQGEAGFFRALFDFTFTHFITVKFSAFLYIVAFLVAILMWLGQIVAAILFGVLLGSANSYFDEASFNAVPLVLAIVFGWIPSVISLIAMRLGLEFSVATVRTAQNTKTIAEAATTTR
ncbi:MAG: DUF4282 domain-containing protein [Brachybacterium alimentarium]